MKTTQSSGTDPVPQTVAGSFQFKNNGKAMAISFTDQRLSPQAGSAIFRGWLPRVDGGQGLAAALPHRLPQSSNHLLPLEKALAFMHGLLGDARKLTPVACLRRDPLVPERIGIKRIASPSGLSRFFQGFNSAATKLRCFRPLWPWGQNRLPSVPAGYPLDLDSTRLLDEDGHQAGVAVGYPRQGLKPCLPPLLAVLAEVRLVAQLWLRPGNAPCGSNVVAFFLDLWENLPDHRRLGGVRADAGFCLPELLAPWEPLPLPHVVVALLQRAGRLSERDQGTTRGLCPADSVSGTVLGQRGGVEPGHVDLQPDGIVSAASGLAAEGDDSEPAVLAVGDDRRVESSGRPNHDQAGHAGTQTRLVAAIMGKDFESLSQRQCSRKPPRFQPVKPHQKSLPIPWLRLSHCDSRCSGGR